MPVYIRSSDTFATDMDGETVMMSISRGQYFGLGGVGSRVWALLEQPLTLDQLVAHVHTEFDVETEQCRVDLTSFLSEMTAHGLVLRQD